MYRLLPRWVLGACPHFPPRMVLPRWFLPLLLSTGTWGYTTSHRKQVGVAIGQPLAPETISLFLLPINPRVWNPLYNKWSQGGVATPQVPSLPSQPSWRGKWTPARAGAGSVSPPPSQSPVLRGSGILGEDLGHGRGLGIIRPPEPTGCLHAWTPRSVSENWGPGFTEPQRTSHTSAQGVPVPLCRSWSQASAPGPSQW